MKYVRICGFTLWVLFLGCTNKPTDGFPSPEDRKAIDYALPWPDSLDRETYRERVLGMLVGSAIGDAMGAPTEMWTRDQIKEEYGFVTEFTLLGRPRSPEGPWGAQMSPGVSTDDTRWKYLLTDFLVDLDAHETLLPAEQFAEFVSESFSREARELSEADLSAQSISRELTHLTWLQEWAMVAGPFSRGDMDNYHIALNKFYGGEMSCAGLLYSPLIGSLYPGNPNLAYINSYHLGIFDLGYARDISALTAAYVAAALIPSTTVEDLLDLSSKVDPHQYGESRLIGRIAQSKVDLARSIVDQARQIRSISESNTQVPAAFPGSTLEYVQLEQAYQLLDAQLEKIPFHAAEIHLINLAALAWAGDDFQKAMEFVVNYGRDNDTVAAVTGAVLGALLGRSRLPAELAKTAEEVNRSVLGLDLSKLADRIVEGKFPR